MMKEKEIILKEEEAHNGRSIIVISSVLEPYHLRREEVVAWLSSISFLELSRIDAPDTLLKEAVLNRSGNENRRRFQRLLLLDEKEKFD